MSSWIILPTLNEIGNLQRMVPALLDADATLRIVIVDDASTDGTSALADEFAARDPRVSVIHRQERGLGTAYLAGIAAATARGGETFLTMDCDFSHDPAQVPALIRAGADADLVIGSRYVTGGRIEGWPLHRRLLSRSANLFAHTLFHLPARDCTSGFRLYRKEIVESIPWERVRSTGYSFLVESLYWATRRTVRVTEVPITFTDRQEGASKLGWREAVKGAWNLLQLWVEVKRERE